MRRLSIIALVAAAVFVARAQEEAKPWDETARDFNWESYIPTDMSETPVVTEIFTQDGTWGWEAYYDPKTGFLYTGDYEPFTTGDEALDAALAAMGQANAVAAQLAAINTAYTNALDAIDQVFEALATHEDEPVEAPAETPAPSTGVAHKGVKACKHPDSVSKWTWTAPANNSSGFTSSSTPTADCGEAFTGVADSISAVKNAAGWLFENGLVPTSGQSLKVIEGISVDEESGVLSISTRDLFLTHGVVTRLGDSVDTITLDPKQCSDDCNHEGESSDGESSGGGDHGDDDDDDEKKCDCEIKTAAQVDARIDAKLNPVKSDLEALEGRVAGLESWRNGAGGYIEPMARFLEKIGWDPSVEGGGEFSPPPRGQ